MAKRKDKKSVLEAVKPLSDYYKKDKIELVRLCLEKDVTVDEIAKALNVTPETVYMFIKRNIE